MTSEYEALQEIYGSSEVHRLKRMILKSSRRNSLRGLTVSDIKNGYRVISDEDETALQIEAIEILTYDLLSEYGYKFDDLYKLPSFDEMQEPLTMPIKPEFANDDGFKYYIQFFFGETEERGQNGEYQPYVDFKIIKKPTLRSV